MTSKSIRVEISKDKKCIYEKNNDVALEIDNLSGLISCLKDTQIEINNFLTSIVEGLDSPINAENHPSSESDSDFEEEVEVNPKKSKLID